MIIDVTRLLQACGRRKCVPVFHMSGGLPGSVRNYSLSVKSRTLAKIVSKNGRLGLAERPSLFRESLFHGKTLLTPRRLLVFGSRSFSVSQRVQQSQTKDQTKDQTKSQDKKINDEDEPEPGYAEVFRLFRLARRDWKLLAVAIGLLTISSLVGMAVPKVIGMVLDATKTALSGDERPKSLDDLPPIAYGLGLYDFFAVFAGALILGTVANFGRVVLLRVLGEKLVARLRSNTIRKIIHQDAEFFDRNRVGDLISRLSSDAYVVSRSMTQNISDGFKAIICGGVGIGMMVHISSALTSALLMFAPPLLIGATIYGNKIRSISRELQQSTGQLTKLSEEQLNGVKTVQSFVAEKKELRRYDEAIRQVFKVGKREAVTNATFFSSTGVLGDLSFMIVLAYGSHLVLQGGLSIGELTAFMLYTEYTGSAVFGLSNFYSELMKGAGAASRLFEMTDSVPKIRSNKGLPYQPGSGHIEFDNVLFSYPTRPSNVIFQGLNFSIEPGSNVCIVGPSGRGKSTIASLLLKYYAPTEGRITIDGQDISTLSCKSLRRYLGVVQQEPMLMSGTIRDNITYGLDRKPTIDEIRSISKQCFCHSFISKLPEGYDTPIGPRGSSLSGGQRQRIAIARALIKKPKILILDEATSALDVESEGAINYTLGKLMRSREITIVSIAHRLSTIRRSENIIVLGDDGRVVEVGKFKDLYADTKSALYKLLHEKGREANQAFRLQDSRAENADREKRPDETEDTSEVNKLREHQIQEQVKKDAIYDQETSSLRP
ncbi:LAMI_0B08350g1_1 [Lachancea mirantina]|uniref:LAMI_0B08350g1_1 n=1 Tax=Lachancea mirantina TaxID=1230905 RepID=A0A1G4IXT3_9SACH|nr:LAMI_0B08350g1_1 [Lachancea mirantina]